MGKVLETAKTVSRVEWETAAMQCIVEQAGGIFRQTDDSEMLYNRENCMNENGFYAFGVIWLYAGGRKRLEGGDG